MLPTDLLEIAWCVIANASDWDNPDRTEWRKAAERWRDKYHQTLNKQMTKTYIGLKVIAAWSEEKDGKPGYAVRYPDGYQSWSPKETFETCYRPVTTDEVALVEAYGPQATAKTIGGCAIKGSPDYSDPDGSA